MNVSKLSRFPLNVKSSPNIRNSKEARIEAEDDLQFKSQLKSPTIKHGIFSLRTS
jgi:hypothetical protein